MTELNVIGKIGASTLEEQLHQLRDWAKTAAVSLKFRSEEHCSFDREESRDVENPSKNVTEVSVGGRIASALTSKVVTKVTEYFLDEQLFKIVTVSSVQTISRLPIKRLNELAKELNQKQIATLKFNYAL